MGTKTAEVQVWGWRIFPFEREGSVRGSLNFITEKRVENTPYDGETQTPPRPVGTKRWGPKGRPLASYVMLNLKLCAAISL